MNFFKKYVSLIEEKTKKIFHLVKNQIKSLYKVYEEDDNLCEEDNLQKAHKKYCWSYGIGLVISFLLTLLIMILFFNSYEDWNLFIILIILFLILALILSVKLVIVGFKNYKIFKKYSNNISRYRLQGTVFHYSGIPDLLENQEAAFYFNSKLNHVIFEDKLSKRPMQIILPLDKICQTKIIAATEVVNESKMGNAFLGGLLFGTMGAVVGALCTEPHLQQIVLYIINYVSDGETKAIVLRYNYGLNSKELTDMIDELMPETNRKRVL